MAIYNSGGYTNNPYQAFNQPQIQPYSSNTQYYNPVIGVVGRGGAESYPVAPGNTVVLADTDPNSGLIFIKSRDSYGNTPIIEMYKKVSVSGNQNGNNSEYVNRESFIELQKTVNEIKKTLDEFVK